MKLGRRLYKRWLQRPLRAAIYVAFLATTAAFRAIGLEASRAIGRAVGATAGAILPYERRLALDNLRLAFPEFDDARRRRIRSGAFRHFGESGAELLHIEATLERVTLTGAEALRDTAARGGAIVVAGHIGNWEVLGAALARAGVPLTVIARRIFDARFDRWMREWRARFGTETVVRGDPEIGAKMRDALARGRALVMLIDQDTDVPSAQAPFFGRAAKTPVGPATFALRGVPAFLATIHRASGGGHLAEVRRLSDLSADVESVTARFNRELEREIRRAPEQWVWFHRRWR